MRATHLGIFTLVVSVGIFWVGGTFSRWGLALESEDLLTGTTEITDYFGITASDHSGLGHRLCSRQNVRKFAASETSSVGQVPALNPAKHRLGSAKRALSYVNAQDLPPSFTL